MMSHNVRMLINIYYNVSCECNEVEKNKQFINETKNQQRIKQIHMDIELYCFLSMLHIHISIHMWCTIIIIVWLTILTVCTY